MLSSGEFHAEEARSALKGKVRYDPQAIVRYPFKPFDVRLAYLDAAIHPLFSRPSPQLLKHVSPVTRSSFRETPRTRPRKVLPFTGPAAFATTIRFPATHVISPSVSRTDNVWKGRHRTTLFAALGEEPEADESVANLSSAPRLPGRPQNRKARRIQGRR